MSDEVDQEDEIGALLSIYNEEEFKCSVGEDGLRTGSFSAFVDVPAGFRVSYNNECNGVEKNVVIPIEHLPPIFLSFKLPKDYPSQSMPQYTLSCSWLSLKNYKILCKKLETLWQAGFVVLFTWTNFLKEESLRELGIHEEMALPRRKPRLELSTGNDQRQNNNRRNPRYRFHKKPKPLDPRINIPTLNIPIHQYLESFNDDRTTMLFMREYHECKICMEEKQGRNCLQFFPCGHVYCKPCMEQYFRTRIVEAMVTSMPCPTDKCTSEALPAQIKDIVGDTLFNRYDTLLLRVTLDKMDDITYCPRISCGKPVVREGEEKMATCPSCRFVFCVFCKRAYHGVEFCRMKSAEMGKIVNEYQEGDSEVKARLEKRYGRTMIQKFVNDMLSDNWIQNNSKNCPKCQASIEKSDGCNKMACSKCGAFFCWLCLEILSSQRPYDHFMDSNSRCRNRLFFGAEPTGDEEFEIDQEGQEMNIIYQEGGFDDEDFEFYEDGHVMNIIYRDDGFELLM